MRTPDEVVAILRLHDGGWGTRKIAREVGCDRETVKRYLASGRWASCRVSKRPGVLDEHAGWIAERFTRHHGIPDWVYSGVVRQHGVPQILTLNPEYFLISQGIGRVIYRLARKAAGRDKATYRLAELHRRSGSTQATPQFEQMVRKFVEKTRIFPLPEYDLEIIPGRIGDMLVMTFRNKDAPLGSSTTGQVAELALG